MSDDAARGLDSGVRPADGGAERAKAVGIWGREHDKGGVDAEGAVANHGRDIGKVAGGVVSDALIDRIGEVGVEVSGVDGKVLSVSGVGPVRLGEGQALEKFDIADQVGFGEKVIDHGGGASGAGTEVDPHTGADAFEPIGWRRVKCGGAHGREIWKRA